MDSGAKIAARIEQIIAKLGISKTKLGVVLGAAETAAPQWKNNKYNSFMNKLKKNNIDLDGLKKIAAFLDQPLDYLLTGVGSDEAVNESSHFNNGFLNIKSDVRGSGNINRISIGTDEKALLDAIRSLPDDKAAALLQAFLRKK